MNRFLAWCDRRNFISVRSIVLGITIWMTWRVTVWAISFSNLWLLADKDGLQTAAVVAAITAPFAALQGFAFKFYVDSIRK